MTPSRAKCWCIAPRRAVSSRHSRDHAAAIDSGRATASDYNQYAWTALLTQPVSEQAVDAARMAYDETQGRSVAINHTLACVYAATGKPREARDLLLKGMEQVGIGKPTIRRGMASVSWPRPMATPNPRATTTLTCRSREGRDPGEQRLRAVAGAAGGADAEMIELPVTYSASRTKMLVLSFSLAFVAIGVVMLRNPAERLMAGLCTGFFGLGVIVALINMHPRASCLTLSEQGFEFSSLFRKHFVAWSDVTDFVPSG